MRACGCRRRNEFPNGLDYYYECAQECVSRELNGTNQSDARTLYILCGCDARKRGCCGGSSSGADLSISLATESTGLRWHGTNRSHLNALKWYRLALHIVHLYRTCWRVHLYIRISLDRRRDVTLVQSRVSSSRAPIMHAIPLNRVLNVWRTRIEGIPIYLRYGGVAGTTRIFFPPRRFTELTSAMYHRR